MWCGPEPPQEGTENTKQAPAVLHVDRVEGEDNKLKGKAEGEEDGPQGDEDEPAPPPPPSSSPPDSPSLHSLRCLKNRWRAARYVLDRAHDNILMVAKCSVVSRTSTLARVFGIDFFSVLSRGSQYRVESMMLRLTKPHNYILLSPSRKQVINQNVGLVVAK